MASTGGTRCAAIEAKHTATEPSPTMGSSASRSRAVRRRFTS